MPRRKKQAFENLEDWVTEVFTEASEQPCSDIHFDVLEDPVRETLPGIALIRESCKLLDRVQSITENFDLASKECHLYVYGWFEPDKVAFPTWNKKFWKDFGKYLEPPSLVIIKGSPGVNTRPEYYVRQIELPFDDYPHLTAVYEVMRTAEEIDKKEPYWSRITITHANSLGKSFKTVI